MGKKKSSGNRCSGGGGAGEKGRAEEPEAAAREFVLKVAMHCRCHGCTGKVRAAVRDVTRARGVEAFDSSAAESSGEVRLRATADPERLRRRLRRATGKRVDLLPLPAAGAGGKEQQGAGGGKKGGGDPFADDAALQALLASLQLQQQAGLPVARQQNGGGQWAANHQQLMEMGLGGVGGWNGAAGGYGYPWPPASSYYPVAAPAATSLAAYAYPLPAPAPAHGNLGYYYGGGGGGAPAWHGY